MTDKSQPLQNNEANRMSEYAADYEQDYELKGAAPKKSEASAPAAASAPVNKSTAPTLDRWFSNPKEDTSAGLEHDEEDEEDVPLEAFLTPDAQEEVPLGEGEIPAQGKGKEKVADVAAEAAAKGLIVAPSAALKFVRAYYSGLRADVEDLVNDCGGSDAFVIEGDSAIIEALSSPELDWSHGGQFLHLSFLIETYLGSLKDRGGNFRLIFFDDHRSLWDEDWSKLLARELMLRHLKINSPFDVAILGTWQTALSAQKEGDDEEEEEEAAKEPSSRLPASDVATWGDYLDTYDPAFVLVNDGEQIDERSAFLLRTFFILCLFNKKNIVYSHLDFRSNQLLGFIVNSYRSRSRSLNQSLKASLPALMGECRRLRTARVEKQKRGMSVTAVDLSAGEFSKFLSLAQRKDYGMRKAISVFALAATLKGKIDGSAEEGEGAENAEKWKLAKAYLVQLAMLRDLSLKQRAQRLSTDNAESADNVDGFRAFLDAVFKRAIYLLWHTDDVIATMDDDARKEISAGLADFFDGRLFAKILEAFDSSDTSTRSADSDVDGFKEMLGLSEKAAEELADAWEEVKRIAGQPERTFFPIGDSEKRAAGKQEAPAATTTPASAEGKIISLLPLHSALVDQVMGDDTIGSTLAQHVRYESDSVAENIIETGKRYIEDHHWHTGESLESDLSREDDTNNWLRQKYVKFMHEYAESLEGSLLQKPIVTSSAAGKEEKEVKPARQQQKAPRQSMRKGPSRKEELKQQNLRRMAKEAEKAAWIQFENLLLEIEEKPLQSALMLIDQYLRGCTVRPVALELNVRKLLLLIHAWLNDRADFQAAKRHLEKIDLWVSKTRIFELAQNTFSQYVDLLTDVHATALSSVFGKIGFNDVKKAVRTAWEEHKSARQSPAGASNASETAAKGRGKGKGKAAKATAKGRGKPAEKPEEPAPSKLAEQLTTLLDRTRGDRQELSGVRFQLKYMGHLLARQATFEPDERVAFYPDPWQKELLDVVDKNGSALVCAPTSSGKTFISYYCMERVLRESDDGVVVYVSPTKALVNQVAAEVYARFGSKRYPERSGRAVYGIFTRDYRHKVLNCQVLVTVPQCLEILLLSPVNSKHWAPRIRYVIFDEVHCIGSMSEGAVWEHLLLLINCPFLALSATVGNPEEFGQWLQGAQRLQEQQQKAREERAATAEKKAIAPISGSAKKQRRLQQLAENGQQDQSQLQQRSYDVSIIYHNERYSDLSKSIFLPSYETYEKLRGGPNGYRLSTTKPWPVDDPYRDSYVHIHPCAALTIQKLKTRGFPRDLAFEPRDSLAMYDAMAAQFDSSTEEGQDENSELKKRLVEALSPESFFADRRCLSISRADARRYEAELKEEFLHRWVAIDRSNARNDDRAESVLLALDGGLVDRTDSMETEWATRSGVEADSPAFVIANLTDLLVSLNASDNLPALVFSFDRQFCERMAIKVTETLEEQQEKAGGSEEAQRVRKLKERELTRAKKTEKRIRDLGEKKISVEEKEIARETEAPVLEEEPDIHPNYTFAAASTLKPGVWSKLMRRLTKDWSHFHPLVRALKRGIGVHHAGLPTKYRQAVEWLFRMKRLRVVFATSTLSLGIHMPCKTVVFAGDSIFLNALSFRQMAGRAGRRGFDLLGKILFLGIPLPKIFRLMTAELPYIRGHFPLTCTLALRCMIVHSQAENEEQERYASDAIVRLFRQPLFCLGKRHLVDQVKHQFRFSLEYLMRESLLAVDGTPINFSGLVSHLYWTEPANFAWLSLLKAGVFDKICRPILNTAPGSTEELQVLKELLFVMCHLFERVPLHSSARRINFSAISPSKVILNPLPDWIARVLEAYNNRALKVMERYVKCFAIGLERSEGASEKDNSESRLPISSIPFVSDTLVTAKGDTLKGKLQRDAIEYSVRSPFVATSGKGDRFSSAEEMARTAREGIYLEPSAMPLLDDERDRDRLPLNSYAFDFFVHGQLKALISGNGLKSGAAYEKVKNFHLVLRAISTSLRRFADDGQLSEGENVGEEEAETRVGKIDPPRVLSRDPVVQAFYRLSCEYSRVFARVVS